MAAAEYGAIQLYMQLAESADNKLAIEVLKDIADEERVHAGAFLRLLREIAADEEKLYAGGAREVEDFIPIMGLGRLLLRYFRTAIYCGFPWERTGLFDHSPNSFDKKRRKRRSGLKK